MESGMGRALEMSPSKKERLGQRTNKGACALSQQPEAHGKHPLLPTSRGEELDIGQKEANNES